MLSHYDAAVLAAWLIAGTMGLEWGHNVTIDPPSMTGGIVKAQPADCAEFAQFQQMAVLMAAFEGGVMGNEAYAATLQNGPQECRSLPVSDRKR